MFKIEPNPTFWATARIHVPGQGLGQIEVEFKHLKHAERRAYSDSLDSKTNMEALTEIIIGWRGIDVAYTSDTLAQLLNEYPTAASALYAAFWGEITGAAEKN